MALLRDDIVLLIILAPAKETSHANCSTWPQSLHVQGIQTFQTLNLEFQVPFCYIQAPWTILSVFLPAFGQVWVSDDHNHGASNLVITNPIRVIVIFFSSVALLSAGANWAGPVLPSLFLFHFLLISLPSYFFLFP